MKSPAKTFEFTAYKLRENKREIELNYAVLFEDGTRLPFTEVVSVDKAIESTTEVLDKTLHTLHLMCGLSYWKTYCPKTIIIKTTALTKDQANFWNTVYTKGLGEFFFRNKIDFRGLISFPFSDTPSSAVSFPRSDKVLMGVGGGKDSLVTFELLKKSSLPISAFILETQKGYSLIDEVVAKMGVDTIRVQRTIDSKLFDTYLLEGSFNGHIPITGIYSVIGLLCAVLFDYKYIAMSNEQSANYGNVSYLGEEINHQWSKSLEFENLFQNYVFSSITPDIIYFSLLRPWTEMRIVEEFVKYPQYFSVFSSCNNNFKVHEKGLETTRWCGHCPKCAFVFSMLAAYLPKSQVLQIFGKNMYADENLQDLYKELLGIKDFKPFECVGTPEEVTAAFYKAQQKGEYGDDVIMKMFEIEVFPSIVDGERLIADAVAEGERSSVPNIFKI